MAERVVNEKLGKILIDQGLIKEEQLKIALDVQAQNPYPPKPIGAYLVDLGMVREADVAKALGIQFNIPVLNLNEVTIAPEALRKIPKEQARKFNVVPVFLVENELTLAVADPTRIDVIDLLAGLTKCRIQPVLVPPGEIESAIQSNYEKRDRPDEVAVRPSSAEPQSYDAAEIEKLRKAGKEVPIIKFVDGILAQAVEEGASDIHIEPSETKMMIRIRVAGILREATSVPMGLHPAVTSRIKILSNLDISERFKPQDGRIQTTLGAKEYDVRVSTVPTVFGEKVVMRLLDRGNIQLTLAGPGLSEPNRKTFQRLIEQPYGIVLVTGPTGSGKSTTLYAALNSIRDIETNIVTVEDPVEYQLPLVNQIQVHPKKDLTFANALRAILRQDPDVIMIGEIRDPETAQIATHAALTGHLVISTLHTNDAPSAVTRLLDIGVEPFLLGPALLGVIGQRLVRKICEKCKMFYTPEEQELERLGLPPMDDLQFARGRKCAQCKQRGYKGRTGIHEVLVMDDDLRHRVTIGATVSEIRARAVENGFTDMRFDGLRKVMAGVTTTEEVLMATKG